MFFVYSLLNSDGIISSFNKIDKSAPKWRWNGQIKYKGQSKGFVVQMFCWVYSLGNLTLYSYIGIMILLWIWA